jgi:Mrp family chromosome partitioning ATPase
MMTSLNPFSASTTQPRNESVQSSAFHSLLYTVFQKPREADSGGIVVAISSPNPGEGVTFVARALLQELSRSEFNSVAGVNTGFLRKLHEPTLEAIRSSLSSSPYSGDTRSISPKLNPRALDVPRGPWEGSWQYRRDCIELLRSEFDYTIIDCPSLKTSGDLLSVAPFVDGVILVVEANRTRRDDPRIAEQSIAAAGGKTLGFILNKRTYELPDWLDRML